jgi:hypothetical protein
VLVSSTNFLLVVGTIPSLITGDEQPPLVQPTSNGQTFSALFSDQQETFDGVPMRFPSKLWGFKVSFFLLLMLRNILVLQWNMKHLAKSSVVPFKCEGLLAVRS